MRCRRFIKLIYAGLNGEISPKEREHLREHLETCQDCLFEFEEANRFYSSLKELSQFKLSAKWTQNFWEGVRSQILERRFQEAELKCTMVKPTKPKIRLRRLVAWGAITAIIVGGLLLIGRKLLFERKPIPFHDAQTESYDIVIESAKIDGRDANVSIIEFRDPDMTLILLD